jgi:hypothetical protein
VEEVSIEVQDTRLEEVDELAGGMDDKGDAASQEI